MGEDQRRVRVALGEPHGVLAQRRDPAAGVDQHGHAALVGERDQLGDRRLVHAELLGARVQLDPARAGVERAPRLGQRAVVRAHAAERDEPLRVRGGRRDHRVVGARGSRPARASGTRRRARRPRASASSSSSGFCL